MHEDVPAPYSYYPWKRPAAWVTWFIVGSTVAVFLLQLVALHLEGDDVVGGALAFTPDAFADHRYWTLLTYAWAHAPVILGIPGLHLIANMIPLICLGPALEEFLGAWRYLGLYLGGVIAAGLVWFVLNPDADQGIIGASGAVFALIAAAGAVAPRASVMVYILFVLPIRMSLRVLALTACGVELAQLLFGWMPEVAHSAHLGGAAFGYLYVVTIRHFSRGRGIVN
jgi:membrane associated rhomboid family serine protease